MHSFIPPSQEGSSGVNPEHTLAIKRWVTELLQLPEDSVVSVNEFPCQDPGCPLLECTVTVFDETRTRTWKLTRPRFAITKLIVQLALAQPPQESAKHPS